MSPDLIVNIAVCVVAVFLIQSVTIYCTVRLVIRGPLFQRREHPAESRLIHMGER